MSNTASEFSCEVVRITHLLPHPNADRLELAKFEMKSGPAAYTVVVGKGDFQVGSLAVYLSVDSIIPLADLTIPVAFLRTAGKTHHRVRAVKLRGQYSEGLLLPTEFPFGHDMTESWGVTYHIGDIKDARKPSTFVGKPPRRHKALRLVEARVPEYSVLNLRKLPNLFEPGELVVLTEKIHGTNFRFGWVRVGRRWEWVVGSHHCIKSQHVGAWTRFKRWLTGWTPPKGYYGEDLWNSFAETRDLRSKAWDYRGLVFYGELFGYTDSGKEIQKGFTYAYDHGKQPTRLRLFDAYDTDVGVYLGRAGLVKFAADMELSVVPTVGAFPYDLEAVKKFAEGKSLLDPGTIREGVVVESVSMPRRKAKWVSEGYRLAQAKGDL